jgi:RNA polymerase sigma factor (sigma-70 family)
MPIRSGRIRQTAAQSARKAAPGEIMQEQPPVDSVAMHQATRVDDAAAPLAQRIRAGDRFAEEELVTTYRRGVFIIAVARTRDREAAADLAQEILIAVLKSLRQGQLRDPAKLAAFIQGTARNLINNHLRVKSRHPEVELDDTAHTADPVEELESLERRRLVRLELQSFSAIDQQILLLSLVDGHSLAEVALRVNLSHDAVRARKSRAVRKITQKFARVSQT